MKLPICILAAALISLGLMSHSLGAEPAIPTPPPPETIPGPEGQPSTTSIVAEPMGSAAEVVAPTLIKLLADPREEMRVWAADSLGKLGPEARQGVPALTVLLGDICPSVRQTAAIALGQMGHASMRAAPELAALLRDQTLAVRNSATAALIEIGHSAQEEFAQKPSAEEAAQRANLHELAKKAVAQVVPEAIALLDDPCWEIRRNAADVLGGIGPSADSGCLGADQPPGRSGPRGPHLGRRRPDKRCQAGCVGAVGRQASQ